MQNYLFWSIGGISFVITSIKYVGLFIQESILIFTTRTDGCHSSLYIRHDFVSTLDQCVSHPFPYRHSQYKNIFLPKAILSLTVRRSAERNHVTAAKPHKWSLRNATVPVESIFGTDFSPSCCPLAMKHPSFSEVRGLPQVRNRRS